MQLIFEWHEQKASENFRKHQVTFEEAKTVFNDPHSITIFDASHSDLETRYVDVGYSAKGRLLVVVYTERPSQIRIISSRRATSQEQRTYYGQTHS
jgi:uncharacterized DUF497 family protein